MTCSSSSASGNDVMGYAMHMIQQEDVDMMLAGGTEAPHLDVSVFARGMLDRLVTPTLAITQARGLRCFFLPVSTIERALCICSLVGLKASCLAVM